MLESFVFVSGAPRSGTTFVSDWLTQLPDGYCVHEVLSDLMGSSCAEALDALARYASTGSDRLAKVKQREFVAWPDGGLRTPLPKIVGWKEPVTWGRGGLRDVPDPLGALLQTHCHEAVVTVRHPYDVVASGRRREAMTSNWRPLSVAQHCSFWLGALDMVRDLQSAGCNVLVLRWEDLLADPRSAAAQLGKLVGRELPAFDGYERDAQELSEMRGCVDSERGLAGHSSRATLTSTDRAEIRRLLQPDAADAGYVLDLDCGGETP